MSVPSFSSFPKRESTKDPKPVFPGPSSRPVNPTSGHDESVIAGPSFSSFPFIKGGTRSQDRKGSEVTFRKVEEGSSREKESRRRRRESSRSRTRSTRDSVRERDRGRDDRRKRSRSGERGQDHERSSRSGRKEKDRDAGGRGSRDGRSRRADPDGRRDKEDRHADPPKIQASQTPHTNPVIKLDLDPKEFYTDTRGDQDILRLGPHRGMRYIPSGREFGSVWSCAAMILTHQYARSTICRRQDCGPFRSIQARFAGCWRRERCRSQIEIGCDRKLYSRT